MTNSFRESFRPAGHRLDLIDDHHVWGDYPAAEVGRRAAPLVAAARQKRAADLATKVAGDSAFGEKAVLGLNATLNALSAGRVHILLFEAEQGGVYRTGADADRLDRAVRDALTSGIEVVPLSGDAAGGLAGAQAAAQLYW